VVNTPQNIHKKLCLKGKNIKAERPLSQKKKKYSSPSVLKRRYHPLLGSLWKGKDVWQKQGGQRLEIISSSLPIRQKRKVKVINAKKDYKVMRMLCVLMSLFIYDGMLNM